MAGVAALCRCLCLCHCLCLSGRRCTSAVSNNAAAQQRKTGQNWETGKLGNRAKKCRGERKNNKTGEKRLLNWIKTNSAAGAEAEAEAEAGASGFGQAEGISWWEELHAAASCCLVGSLSETTCFSAFTFSSAEPALMVLLQRWPLPTWGHLHEACSSHKRNLKAATAATAALTHSSSAPARKRLQCFVGNGSWNYYFLQVLKKQRRQQQSSAFNCYKLKAFTGSNRKNRQHGNY